MCRRIRRGCASEEVIDDAGRAAYDRALVEGYPIADLAAGELSSPGGSMPRAGACGSATRATGRSRLRVRGPTTASSTSNGSRPDPSAAAAGTAPPSPGAATLADPSKHAVLIASDDGRSVYERMGYLPLTCFTLWIGRRG